MSVTQPVIRHVTSPVSVTQPVPRVVNHSVSVSHHVPRSVTPLVSVSNVCKPVNHTPPMRRLNKVKPPKYEKCDYVHVSSSPVSVSVSHSIPHPVHRRRHSHSVSNHVKCNVSHSVKRNGKRHVKCNVTQPVKCDVKCPVPCKVNHTVSHSSSAIDLYFFLFTLINIFYGIIFTPVLGNDFNNVCFLITINLLLLFIKIMYIFLYCFVKILKHCYRYFLILFLIYIFIITLTEFSSDVNFVNQNSNANLSNFKDFKTHANNLLYKPKQYHVLNRASLVNKTIYFNTNIFSRLYYRDHQLSEEKREPVNNETFCFLLILNVLLIFKNSKKPFFGLFYFSMFILLLQKSLPIVSNIDEELISCNKKEFFTIESFKISNAYANFCLRNNFKLYVFSEMKYKSNPLFLKYLLLLSGDISLNPGPSQIEPQLNNNDIFLPFQSRGLHFLHLNINSLLPKIDELRNIADKSKVAVIGISGEQT